MEQEQAFIARQPILNLQQQIVAYELLFRDSAEASSANIQDDLQASVRVLVNTLSDIGAQWLLNDKLAFVMVGPDILHNELLELLPPARTVLALLENVPADEASLQRCRDLRALGYQIALKDRGMTEDRQPLLACADYVKIDVLALAPPEVHKRLAIYQRLPLKIIAEKVETRQQFQACKLAGFHLIQGFYFARPETFSAKVIHPAFSTVLELLNLVNRDADMAEIEAGFKHDPALSFKLLRYINSVGFGLSCEIQSIRHALTVIGTKQLYRWLTLLMVTAGHNSAPPALMKTAIIRGRFTELLGYNYFDRAGRDHLFTIGAFSLLDSMLSMSMPQILQKIDLPEIIHEALLHRKGVYGPFLALAEACENADVLRVGAYAENLHLHPAQVNKCHMEALAWAEEFKL